MANNHMAESFRQRQPQQTSSHKMNKTLLIIISLWTSAITMSAQSFTDHLTQKVEGHGTVTVHQDSLIDNLVNGKVKASTVAEPKEDSNDSPVTHTGKKIRARGYRIQVYWGGSTTNDKTKAQYAGLKVTSAFPELQSYTTFESPNWRCRVGDFVSRQEASDFLDKLKDARVVQNAIIVKSEVLIYQ